GLPAGGLGCDIIVELQTADVGGTNDATSGSDYTLSVTSVTFLSGMTINGDTQCAEIQIVDDDIYEEDEVFLVSISTVTPSSAAMIGT
ncbi:Sodium/calcium exchanger 1, partial [Geodia barretti]